MKSDSFAKVTVRRLLSLPLLPVDQMARGFETIRQTVANDNTEVQSILAYFDDEWMLRIGPEDFCIHNIYDRTNNSSENSNYWFKRYFKINHTIWNFVGKVFTIIHNIFLKLPFINFSSLARTRRMVCYRIA
jgi:hypothetical protein